MNGLYIFLICVFSFLDSCIAQSCPTGVPRQTYPDPVDCQKYYECDNGNLIHLDCTEGTYYNNSLQACATESECRYHPFVCPPGIDYYPYFTACEFYIECYNGIPNLMFCPMYFYFDSSKKMCVLAAESNCGEYATTSSPWPTPGGDCQGVLPGTIELRPLPGDCGSYLLCNGNLPTKYPCPPGLWFDAQRNMCNFPDLVNCQGTTDITPPTDTTIDSRCEGGISGYFGVVDCTKFLECVAGVGYILPCPPGLNFDVIHQICLDPSSAVCEYTTSTQQTQSTVSPNPSCANEPNGKTFPYPGHCHLYLECVNGELTVQECPDNLYYSMLLEVCDYPYEAHCPWA